MFEPYYDFSPRRWFKPDKHVRHQQTCPVCGRKLVNTYLQDGVWKCQRCWEENGDVFDLDTSAQRGG